MLHFVCSTGANLRWLIFSRALDTLRQIKKEGTVFKYYDSSFTSGAVGIL